MYKAMLFKVTLHTCKTSMKEWKNVRTTERANKLANEWTKIKWTSECKKKKKEKRKKEKNDKLEMKTKGSWEHNIYFEVLKLLNLSQNLASFWQKVSPWILSRPLWSPLYEVSRLGSAQKRLGEWGAWTKAKWKIGSWKLWYLIWKSQSRVWLRSKLKCLWIVLQGIKYSAKLDLLNKLSFRASFVVNYDPLPSLLAAWLRASFEPLAISDYFPFVLRTPNEYE